MLQQFQYLNYEIMIGTDQQLFPKKEQKMYNIDVGMVSPIIQRYNPHSLNHVSLLVVMMSS